MTLVKWTPITKRPAFNIFDDINRMINHMTDFVPVDENTTWCPAMDIREGKDSYNISVDMPGMEKKDISISVTDGVLKISGERKTQKNEKDDNAIINEVSYGKFSRTLTLSENVDEDNISANFKNGVLNLKIAKVEPVKPPVKQIAIK